jgi:hypothetical protein
MINENQDTERDKVLFTLHKSCSNPTAAEIDEWVKQYPQYADDIRSHAAIIKDWAARKGLPGADPDPAMVSRSQSRTLDALHKARAAGTSNQAALTFDQIMAASGTNVPDLARNLDINRGVLAALVGGRMLAPVGERLVSALVNCWAITIGTFDSALHLALTAPRLGIPKAASNPTIIPHSYEHFVRSSSMTDARKKYWLGEE